MTPILLDTHIFIWALMQEHKIPAHLRSILENPNQEIYVSSASSWEISIKHHLGKLPGVEKLLRQFPSCLQQAQFQELAITSKHCILAGSLPAIHKDPFDRILAAQSTLEKMPLMTLDPIFIDYGITLV